MKSPVSCREQGRVHGWREGDSAADYALVWKPAVEVLAGRERLKAVFNLGVGVDALLGLLRGHPDLLPPHVPVIKLDDAGMAPQMIQYVLYAVLRHFRRFDEYADFQRECRWQPLEAREPLQRIPLASWAWAHSARRLQRCSRS